MKFSRRAVSLIIAAAFVFCCLPAFAVGGAAPKYPTPEGYSDNDYQKLAAFLEIADEDGVRNGEKIDPDYDPLDPETWGSEILDFAYDPPLLYTKGVEWQETDGLKHAVGVVYDPYGYDPETDDYYEGGALIGELNVSGMTELRNIDVTFCALDGLDASGCSSLSNISLYENNLTFALLDGCTSLEELDVGCNSLSQLGVSGLGNMILLNAGGNCLTDIDLSGCSSIQYLGLSSNFLREIDLSPCPSLIDLNIRRNLLTELDLSCCPAIDSLSCEENYFTDLDFSANDGLFLDRLRSEGDGYVGYDYWFLPEDDFVSSSVYAVPGDSGIFEGWYTADGELVSTETEFGGYSELDDNENVIGPDPIAALGERELVARFSDMRYNESDAAKARAFLEIEDENGVKNGEKISESYDPDDPGSWHRTEIFDDGEDAWEYSVGFMWLVDEGSTEAGLSWVVLENDDIVGELDLSGCNELGYIYCVGCDISSVLLDNCATLTEIYCVDDSLLEELSFAGSTWVYMIECSGTAIGSIDLSDCPELSIFSAVGTNVTLFDFTNCSEMVLDRVEASEGGTVGVEYYCPYRCYVYAAPEDGYTFEGWYDGNGGLISDDPVYGGESVGDMWDDDFKPDPIYSSGITEFYARFVPAELIPGDANGDGTVGMDDVLLVMRCVLGVQELPEGVAVNCDANGDGALDLADALLILRGVLGITL